MKQSKTTIHEIARRLDTSAATVSRALNNHPRISKKMKERVADMALQIGYKPNAMASALRNGRSKLIGIIVPFADRIFFSSVIRGIEEEVKKSGYNVIICQSYEKINNEIEDVEALLSAQVAGMIVSISRETETVEHLLKVSSKNKPVVLFDRTKNNLEVSSVLIDDFQGAYEATSHLITQGYRRIAFFSGNRSVSIFEQRHQGYIQALKDYHLPITDQLIVNVPSDVDQGRMATEELMALKDPPDAIFSTSDFSALGAIKWLIKNGYHVPRDVGVIGFGNDPFTEHLDPSMTTIDQKSKEMGIRTAQVFLEQINGTITSPMKIILQPELIVRESTGRTIK